MLKKISLLLLIAVSATPVLCMEGNKNAKMTFACLGGLTIPLIGLNTIFAVAKYYENGTERTPTYLLRKTVAILNRIYGYEIGIPNELPKVIKWCLSSTAYAVGEEMYARPKMSATSIAKNMVSNFGSCVISDRLAQFDDYQKTFDDLNPINNGQMPDQMMILDFVRRSFFSNYISGYLIECVLAAYRQNTKVSLHNAGFALGALSLLSHNEIKALLNMHHQEGLPLHKAIIKNKELAGTGYIYVSKGIVDKIKCNRRNAQPYILRLLKFGYSILRNKNKPKNDYVDFDTMRINPAVWKEKYIPYLRTADAIESFNHDTEITLFTTDPSDTFKLPVYCVVPYL